MNKQSIYESYNQALKSKEKEYEIFDPKYNSVSSFLYFVLEYSHDEEILDFFEKYQCDTELLSENMHQNIISQINASVEASVTRDNFRETKRNNDPSSKDIEFFKRIIRLTGENMKKYQYDEKNDLHILASFLFSLIDFEYMEHNYSFHRIFQESYFDIQSFMEDYTQKTLSSESFSKIEEICVNLNKKAKKGLIDPVVGRDKEIEQSLEVLNKRKKSNLVLVGKAGCGKTSIAEGIALAVENKDVPENLQNIVLYQLKMGSLVQGTKFRGDFEQKVDNVIKELVSKKESGEEYPILFIDEIHQMMGAGAVNGGSLDFANMIKEELANGSISVIGSTTIDEYDKYIVKDEAIRRRFVKIDVLEPTFDETIEIMMGVKKPFEEKHNVNFTKNNIEYIVQVSDKFMSETARPDRAIDFLDYIGSVSNINGSQKVTKKNIEECLKKLKGITTQDVEKNLEKKSKSNKDLKSEILKSLFGQDEAVEKTIDLFETSILGLKEHDKTMGNVLFLGPTGVGKTELAKQLHKVSGLPLERIDMSEYMEKHSISKLIGTSSGYVGYDDAPLLSQIINKNKNCILLFDEVEKAHPDILNVLLQIMDNAEIKDGKNKVLDFRNTFIILTSNSGATELKQKSIGLSKNTSVQKTKSKKIVNSFFKSELRGRLDEIIYFNSLTNDQYQSIIKKSILELQDLELLKKNNVKVTVSDEVLSNLVELEFDETLGVRNFKKTLNKKLLRLLKEELKKNKLKDKVLLKWEDNQIVIKL